MMHDKEILDRWAEAKKAGRYLPEGKYDLKGTLIDGCLPAPQIPLIRQLLPMAAVIGTVIAIFILLVKAGILQ